MKLDIYKNREIERTKVRINAKGGRKAEMSAQEGLSLSSIFEAKPIFEILGLLFDVSKLRLMTRSIIGLRFWDILPASQMEEVKGMSKSIKNCANYLRNIN